jgi:endonuclease YncB( thermonuclease family)
MTRLLPLACIGIAVLGFAALRLSHAQGAFRVVDGDSIVIGTQRIRLAGIDAPELAQTCADGWKAGQDARSYLLTLLEPGAALQCAGDTQDRYGRTLGTCSVGNLEINRSMVREGFAWAYVRFSRAYQADEAEARAAKRGIWAHDCQPAWDWRREHR